MFNNDEPKIKGIKKLFIKNQTIISSGLPSLDSIIGKRVIISLNY